MANNLRVAIVGFGKLGLMHAGIFNTLPGSDLAAVVEPSAQIRSILKAVLPKVAILKDLSELQSVAPDIVVVATPPDSHVEIAQWALERGAATFIEKPLSCAAASAKELVDYSQKHPEIVSRVGYMNRFNEMFGNARKIINSGALGRIMSVRSSMYIAQVFKKSSNWRFKKQVSGGGVLLTQNCHLIDMLTWIFGPFTAVSARSRKLYSAEVEDEIHAHFKLNTNIEGEMDCSWSKPGYRTLTMQISVGGSNGNLDVDEDQLSLNLKQTVYDYPHGTTKFLKAEQLKGVSFDLAGAQYTRQAEEFMAAVRGESLALQGANISSAFLTQCIIDSMYNSAASDGSWTTVNYHSLENVR